MKKINHLRWGAIITYLTLFLNIVISIIYTPIMLRLLGPGEHGLYSTVSTTISWMSLLSLGVGSSYIRFFSKYKVGNQEDDIARLNGLFIIFYMFISIITLFCGFVLSKNLNLIFADGISQNDYLTANILTKIVTIDFAISFPASLFNAYIRANEKFIVVKLVSLFQCITSPLITLPLLFMGYGSIGMVIVTTIVDLLAYLINVFTCFKNLNIKFIFSGFEKGLIKSIFSFSFFIAVNSIINMLNTSVDKIVLARYIGTVSVSIYTIGYSLYSYYSSFSSAIAGIMVPRINLIVNKYINDKQKLRSELTEQFIKFGRIQFFIQMLMLTGIIFFGQAFIKLWAGDMYDNSYYIAVILCASYTIPLCQNIGAEIQRAQNKHQIRTVVFTIMTLINIVLTIILCKKYGEIGAVIGTAISAVIVEVIFMNIYYHKRLNINVIEYWKNFVSNCKGLIIPIIIGILIYKYAVLTDYFSMLLYIILYAIIYCISMWFLVMNQFEKDLFMGKILKMFRRNNNE